MGRDQEVDQEEDSRMTSNIGKGPLGLEKREIDNSGERKRRATSNSEGTEPRCRYKCDDRTAVNVSMLWSYLHW